MAQQQMRSSGGYAPLRVQRTFHAMDDGRGARAAALAESLGVIMNTVPQIAKMEGDNAFEAGMRARIDGVQRENAQTANKSMLGFMFSQRARDGFDYQDAQLELPVLQSEELLDMESRLRESRNPEDFRAYIAERDAAIQQRLEGKSDMYRYTVAEAMMKTRESHAKLFTQWVVNNREKDRSAAAKAAAKAAAEQRAALAEAAELEAGAISRGVVVDGETLSTSGTTVSTPEVTPSGSGGGTVPAAESAGGVAVTGTASVGTGTGEPQVVSETGQVSTIPAPPSQANTMATAFEEYVRTAPTKYGISTSDAKSNFMEALINRADQLNDERELELVPREHLNLDQNKKLNDAIDTIRNERLSREAEDAAARDADIKATAAAVEAEGKSIETDVSTQVALRQMSVQEAINHVRSHPYYRDAPEEAAKAIDRLNKINNAYSDPAMEAFDLAQFQELVVRRVSQGHVDGLEDAFKNTLMVVASDSGRAKVVDIFTNAEKWARDQIFDGLDEVAKDITQTFPSGIGQSEQTVASVLAGEPSKKSYPPEAATRVTAEYEKHMIGLVGDWYTENQDMPRMPHAVKLTIAEQAYNLAISYGKRRYEGGDGESTTSVSPKTSADYLRSIAGD